MIFIQTDAPTIGALIILSILLLLIAFPFLLLSYHMKLIFMTSTNFFVIMPFRFRYENLRLDKITELRWDLLEVPRLGIYRKLNIYIHSNLRINISDLELLNYNRIEKWLIEHTHLNPDLKKKVFVELQQAKANRWFNIIAILVLISFSLFLFTEEWNIETIISIHLVLLIIILHLIVRLVYYEKIIFKNDN